MKKLLVVAMAATTMLAFSCNPKNEKGKEKEEVASDEQTEEEDEFDKAAVAYCKCYQKNEESIPSGLKKLMKNASKSDDPTSSMQEDYANLTPEDQKAFDEVMADGSDLNQCFEKVKKKYGFDDKDVTTLRKLKTKVADQDDCGFVNDALALAISMQKGQKKKRATSTDDDVTEE